jgi:hypothetical protein
MRVFKQFIATYVAIISGITGITDYCLCLCLVMMQYPIKILNAAINPEKIF